jgi:hypothetical protein
VTPDEIVARARELAEGHERREAAEVLRREVLESNGSDEALWQAGRTHLERVLAESATPGEANRDRTQRVLATATFFTPRVEVPPLSRDDIRQKLLDARESIMDVLFHGIIPEPLQDDERTAVPMSVYERLSRISHDIGDVGTEIDALPE